MVKMDKEITYLVKYTDKTQDKPMPANLNLLDNWEYVDVICEGNSLRDINQYLMTKELPIINSMVNARLSGIILVYSISATEQLYAVESKHPATKAIIRDIKLKRIIKGS